MMLNNEQSSTKKEFKPDRNESNDKKSRLMEKFQALKDRRKEIANKKYSSARRTQNSNLEAHVKEQEKIEKEDDRPPQSAAEFLEEKVATKKRKNSDWEDQDKTNFVKKESQPSRCKQNSLGRKNETWKDVQSYLDVNKHLQGVDRGKYAQKTKLEEDIDAAIAAGNYEKAEELSDQLSQRNFGEKIANAFDAKRYAEKKKKEDEMAKVKRQKKLHWGFDHKERWEMKGNM